MGEAYVIGHVLPRYGTLRRFLLPIYGADQLAVVALATLPLVWLASVNPKLALYAGLGAYIGFVAAMQRSTPASVLLRATDGHRVAAILGRSRFFKAMGDGQWNSTKGRLHRWDTDNIRLQRDGQTLRLTGRQIDLQKVVAQLRA